MGDQVPVHHLMIDFESSTGSAFALSWCFDLACRIYVGMFREFEMESKMKVLTERDVR